MGLEADGSPLGTDRLLPAHGDENGLERRSTPPGLPNVPSAGTYRPTTGPLGLLHFNHPSPEARAMEARQLTGEQLADRLIQIMYQFRDRLRPFERDVLEEAAD